jgi:hypothetical protein
LNLSTSQDFGAYHASELPLIFGIPPYGKDILGNTDAEVAMMKYLSGAWATFAKDPVNGLKGGNYTWPGYQPGGQTLVKLAENGSTGPGFSLRTFYDSACTSSFPPAAGNGILAGNGSSTVGSNTTSNTTGSTPTGTGSVIATATGKPKGSASSVIAGSLGSIVFVPLLVLGILLLEL